MTKLIPATCNPGKVVTVDGVVVPDVDVLSLGTKASEGYVLIDKDLLIYLTSNAQDIKLMNEKIVQVINQIEGILSGMDAISNSPGSQTSNLIDLAVYRGELADLQESIK